MNRYINANALAYKVAINGDADFINKVIKLMIDAPSIDITFCEECECSSSDGTYGCMIEHFNDAGDAYHRMWTGDFCSRGKRKELCD